MNKAVLILLACLSFCIPTFAKKPKSAAPAPPATLTIREIHYNGTLSDNKARFTLNIDAEATDKGSMTLLEGDVAILPSKLPRSLKIVRTGNRYTLVASCDGHYRFQLDVVAKIQRNEPWNEISFTGPAATIASITAQAAGADTEVQLLNGTLLASVKTNGLARVTGYLGADQTVDLRWQTRVARVAHKALLTVDSTFAAQVAPTRFNCSP